ncbi:MAG: dynamin family protein [Rhodomicrobium sp.]
MSYDAKDAQERGARSLLNKKTAHSLREIRDELVRSGFLVEEQLHGRVAWFANNTLKRLEQHKARIAFVGQVKGGKSSVINAFMKRPDFLPTDVNPSTAVITKVYFDSLEHPANTALFHFFTEQEWEELFAKPEARDPNQTGFMSLPGTKRSLDALRQRAQERLGPDYAKLIGKHHLFSAVTPEIVESYVSTGDFTKKAAPLQSKLFSDVTRMAEVFLDDNPIFYPSVLIDTPGINDLFFVRDEITRANLADADVYVLVLTAQQPLSRSDISLLRLLRGLKRDRIIAVINRIDTLSDIQGEGAHLRKSVQEALRRELPHTDIPIILTSALWANAALKESPFAIEGLITPQFVNYASHCGVRDLLDPSPGRDPDEVLGRFAKALLASSGLPELADRINQFIANSIVEEQLLPASSTLSAISHNSAVAARYGVKALTSSQGEGLVGNAGGLPRKEAALESLSRLEKFVLGSENLLREMQKDWKSFADAEVLNLQRYLMYAVEKFSNTQSFLLFEDRKYSSAPEDLFQNTLIFRSQLADTISKNYNEICRLLFSKQHGGEVEIRRATKEIIPAIDDVMRFGMKPSKASPVYLIPLAKATIFEVDDFWQHEIVQSKEPNQKKAQDLKTVVFSEFYPIIKEIIDAANLGLELTVDEIISHLRVFVFSSIFPIVQQFEQFQNLYSSNPTSEEQAEFMRKFTDDTRRAVEFFETKSEEIDGLKKMMFSV